MLSHKIYKNFEDVKANRLRYTSQPIIEIIDLYSLYFCIHKSPCFILCVSHSVVIEQSNMRKKIIEINVIFVQWILFIKD